MPKYTLDEVIDIIQALTPEEKTQLQAQLPTILAIPATSNSPSIAESNTQTMQGITIGNSNAGLQFVQADRGSNVAQTETNTAIQNADLQEALSVLAALKQEVTLTDQLNALDKQMVEVPIQTIQAELKKPTPDKSLVDQAIEALKKGLAGVEALAGPVAQVAALVANAWLVI